MKKKIKSKSTLASTAKLINLVKRSREAFLQNCLLPIEIRNLALQKLSEIMERQHANWLKANQKDLNANLGKISDSLYSRLKLDNAKVSSLISGIHDLIHMDDPIHQTLFCRELDHNLILTKRSVPLGVLAIIFESRPDVMPQILSLVLKTGTVAILKGGKEATRSNHYFMNMIKELNRQVPALHKHWSQMIETREEVSELLNYPQYVDLVIPRGSNQLVQSIMQRSKIPVLGHAEGICHVYVDSSADLNLALKIVRDSKVQSPTTCNAMETLLVHESIHKEFLPMVGKMAEAEGCQIWGCNRTAKLLKVKKAKTWSIEFSNLNFNLRVVKNFDEAVHHINSYGSHHTDSIVSKDPAVTDLFISKIDSASVIANASTRFADGFRYGFGAEIGVSTSRIHARGPVGMEGLITYKYELRGSGQLVATYVGDSAKKFTHVELKVETSKKK